MKPMPMLILRPSGSLTSGKLAGKLWSPASPTQSNDTPSTVIQNGIEARKQVQEAAIDPLSQVCTHRAPDAGSKKCRELTGTLCLTANPPKNEYAQRSPEVTRIEDTDDG
jgi:hypothetical protein